MTSKDKLIEFLKSANIDYKTEQDFKDKCDIDGQNWVITHLVEYYFNEDNSFQSMNTID